MMKICQATSADMETWDAYVLNHPNSTHCHLSGWKHIFEKTYKHKGHYLLAQEGGRIKGVLPLCLIKSFFFGRQLVSLPFLNYGGMLADSGETGGVLIEEAIRLGKKIRISQIELRLIHSLGLQDSPLKEDFSEGTRKVRMVLRLPVSKKVLLDSYKAKMKSQIFRANREGMQFLIGGAEFLNDFFEVFSVNMRDLGSPVHSKKFFLEILSVFKSHTRIGIVRFQNRPVAGGLIICFKDGVEIPWASSLRKFNKFSPNMLLYWSFLEYACDQGYNFFDFGRSTFGEGTYKFKQQWGAEAFPLQWAYWTATNNENPQDLYKNKKLLLAGAIWKKLPLPVTIAAGPHLRRRITL